MPDYLARYSRELEHERPVNRPHLQDYAESSQEQWGWLEKEEGYKAEIGKLKQQIRNLEFKSSVQTAADEGYKKNLTQENEMLRAQIQKMRIDADKQQRIRSDERLIQGLNTKFVECRDELKKSEGTIAELQVLWAKRTKDCTQYSPLRTRQPSKLELLKLKVDTAKIYYPRWK